MSGETRFKAWKETYLDVDLPRPTADSPPGIAAAHCQRQTQDMPLCLLSRHEMLCLLAEMIETDVQQADRKSCRDWADALKQDRVRLAAMTREFSLERATRDELGRRAALLEEQLQELQQGLQSTESALAVALASLQAQEQQRSSSLLARLSRPLLFLRGICLRLPILIREPTPIKHGQRLLKLLRDPGPRVLLQRLAEPGLANLEGTDGARVGLAGGTGTGDALDHEYERWRQEHAIAGPTARAGMKAWIARQEHLPLLSIVMPVFDTEPRLLQETLESVRGQIYPHWQLCIADDASTSLTTRKVLEHFGAIDPRIQIRWRTSNGHICAASNTALEDARGDYVGFLDHDDLLAPDALYWIARTVHEQQALKLIYSDEDKVDLQGQHYDPYFKPDWNPDLLRSQNYINHLCFYRSDLLREAEGLREGFEGSQDYDLLLRCTERLQASEIAHVPRVLYHWRASKFSEALQPGIKSYARRSARRALEEHLERCGIEAEVMDAADIPGMWRIRHALPEPAPRASILIATRNRRDMLEPCLESLLRITDYPDFETIIIDNGSDDPGLLGLLEELQGAGRIRVLRDERPFNFSALNNLGAAHARGEVLVLLNNDVEIMHADWLRELVSQAVRPEIGVVGARLWYPDGRLQHAGAVLGIGGVAGHAFKGLPRGEVRCFGRSHLIQNYSAVTGACLAVRRELFMAIDGMNESLAVAFNDIDFCLKVRKLGYRNLWTPYAELLHHESASRGHEDTPGKQRRFAAEVRLMQQLWGESLSRDPAYNPNLSMEREDFSLAWPPRPGDAVIPGQESGGQNQDWTVIQKLPPP